jgi:hypothetical protein
MTRLKAELQSLTKVLLDPHWNSRRNPVMQRDGMRRAANCFGRFRSPSYESALR